MNITFIMKRVDASYSQVLEDLRLLKERKLVEITTPSYSKRSREIALTEKGERIAKALSEELIELLKNPLCLKILFEIKRWSKNEAER